MTILNLSVLLECITVEPCVVCFHTYSTNQTSAFKHLSWQMKMVLGTQDKRIKVICVPLSSVPSMLPCPKYPSTTFENNHKFNKFCSFPIIRFLATWGLFHLFTPKTVVGEAAGSRWYWQCREKTLMEKTLMLEDQRQKEMRVVEKRVLMVSQ